MLPYLDIILLDIKIPDPEKHRKYCGVDNRLLLENIEKLAGVAVDIYVRVPVIPGINDDPASIAEIAAIAARLDNLVSIKLLPFHKLGGGKYKALDRAYEIDGLDTPSKEQMEKLNKIIVDAGLNVE